MKTDVSLKRVDANRKNARKSTGPKTPAGKANSALNATKHGLLSKQVLLSDEDENTLVDFGKRLRTQLQPVGELEVLLVDRIIAAAWRLRRVLAVEVGIFESERTDIFGAGSDLGLAFIRDGNGADAFSKLSRYESAIERGFYRALHELQRLQAERLGADVPPPAVIEVGLAAAN